MSSVLHNLYENLQFLILLLYCDFSHPDLCKSSKIQFLSRGKGKGGVTSTCNKTGGVAKQGKWKETLALWRCPTSNRKVLIDLSCFSCYCHISRWYRQPSIGSICVEPVYLKPSIVSSLHVCCLQCIIIHNGPFYNKK